MIVFEWNVHEHLIFDPSRGPVRLPRVAEATVLVGPSRRFAVPRQRRPINRGSCCKHFIAAIAINVTDRSGLVQAYLHIFERRRANRDVFKAIATPEEDLYATHIRVRAECAHGACPSQLIAPWNQHGRTFFQRRRKKNEVELTVAINVGEQWSHIAELYCVAVCVVTHSR